MSKRRRSRLGLDEIAEPPSFNTLTGICQKIADSFADSLKKQDLPDIPHLTSILTAIPGMTEDLMFPAVDILGADPRMLNTFVGMADDTIRMRWLRWKLKSIGYPLASEYGDDQTPAP